MEMTTGFDMALTFRASRNGLETAHVGARRGFGQCRRVGAAGVAAVESCGDDVAETSKIVEFPASGDLWKNSPWPCG